MVCVFDLHDISFPLGDSLCCEGHRAAIGNGITNTDAEAVMKEPEDNNPLFAREALTRPYAKDNMDEATASGTNGLLHDTE